MLRVKERPDEPAGYGWIEVFTPAGGTVFTIVNSPAHDLCVDWVLLRKGRGGISAPEYDDYVDGGGYVGLPCGMLAELLWLCGRKSEAAELLTLEPSAIDYLRRLWQFLPEQDRPCAPELAELASLAQVVALHRAALEVLHGC